jgi:hypothetical protein
MSPLHKALPPEQKWERTLHTNGLTCSLIVEPGELIIDGKLQSFGVPFGPTARLILLFLQTQALEQRSREIEVGNTTYAWLRRLGLSVGGQDYRRFREQMMRLVMLQRPLPLRESPGERCSDHGLYQEPADRERCPVAARRRSPDESLGRPGRPERELLQGADRASRADRHARDQGDHAFVVALDVYGWLSYRLHVLERPKTVGWAGLMTQFGIGYSRLRRFKERFSEALELALCVYPQARVSLGADGITLYPSPPPIGEGRHLRLVPVPKPA